MTIKTTPLILLLLLPFAALPHSKVDQESDPGQENQIQSQMVVPEGTVIPIVLTVYLNTRSSQPGDTFYAETAYPVWIQQRLVIPKGSLIRGTVTNVHRPGRIKGKGRLAVRFDDILLPNGVRRELVASFRGIHGPGEEKLDRNTESVSAGGSGSTDAETIVSTTSQGAIIGVIADRGSGAAIGAGAGAAAGAIITLLTRGRDLVLSPGTQFDLELIKPLKYAHWELEFTDAQLNSAQKLSYPRPAQDNQQNRVPRVRRTGPFGGIGWPDYWFR